MTVIVTIDMGGTSANTAAGALTALGAANVAAYAQANTAYAQANSAYAAANTASTTANNAGAPAFMLQSFGII